MKTIKVPTNSNDARTGGFRAGRLCSTGAVVSLLLASASGALAADTSGARTAMTTAPAAAAAMPLQTAVFSGGCFWGVQAVFEHVHGVHRVVAGYAGGDRSTAEYEVVGTGMTGHAESVEVTFDPAQVTYGDLLRVFFSVAHDPTEVNRQGPDSGTQYRSEIFYLDAQQAATARAYIAQLDQAHIFNRPIATRVDPLKGFYPAEQYHQDYLQIHPDAPYIVYNDLPKVRHLQQALPALYQDTPVKYNSR